MIAYGCIVGVKASLRTPFYPTGGALMALSLLSRHAGVERES